jgi:hypothetical protein
VASGPDATKSATADTSGAYALPSLAAGAFTLHTAARGYLAIDENVTVSTNTRHDVTLQREPQPALAAPQCDARLWSHVYDPVRLKVVAPCESMTGVVATQHHSDDGDIDMRVVPDAPFAHLLNAANNGSLQVEAICQGKILPDTPAASVSCRDFTGSVTIPAVGAHVQVTGSYVLDTNHGWMEIHPTTTISVIP